MHRNRVCSLLALAVAMFLWAAPAQSESVDDDARIRMVIEPWGPFVDDDLPGQGFFAVLVKEAFAAAGYEATLEFVPWARALRSVERGDRDVLVALYYSDERAEKFWYSEPVYETHVGLIARAGIDRDTYDSLTELTDYRIGVGRGFVNSPEFDAAAEDYLNVEVQTDQKTNVRMLFAGRIDMITGSFDRVPFEARGEGHDPSSLVFLEPPLVSHDIHIGVSRAHPDGERIRDDFDRGLDRIRSDGTYDEILAEYRTE